jgi:hypothetical protein
MPRWALVLATPGLFLGVTGGLEALSRPWRERRALAGLPPPSEGAPNVLLLILDTVRAANLSVYGYARPTTPAMERVAAEGALFLDAYATAPWTLPSHTSLFTGLLPGQADADWTVPLGDQPATLAEVLRSQGFATAGFVANPIYTQRETGLSRGFIHYSTSRRSLIQLAYSNAFAQIGVMRRAIQRRDLREIIRSLDRNTARIGVAQASHRKPAFLVVDEFLAWLATAGPDRPFFAFLNLFDAHAPYLNTDPERFQHLEAATPGRRGLYDAAIASQDAHVGRLLDSLKVRGILDRTLVIVASDHGELFGEHDLHGHGNSLYRQVLHVPLLLRYPARIQAGTRVRRPVSIRDVPVTVLDILAQERGEWQGRSLLSSTAGMARQRQGRAELQVPMAVAEVSGNPDLGGDGAPAHEGDIRSIFGYGLHLIVGPRGESQLYEYMRDTAELNDLVGHPAYRDREATLRRFLDSVPSRLEPTASVRGRGGR